MTKYSDPYSQHMRDEQKAILNGLIGIIYDNFDSTRRIQATVESTHRIAVTILVLFVLLIAGVLLFFCFFGCRRYQSERSPVHGPRKSAPIEI